MLCLFDGLPRYYSIPRSARSGKVGTEVMRSKRAILAWPCPAQKQAKPFRELALLDR